MAGIGFELQKLVQRDDLWGPARGYLYSAAIVAGPWILTVAAIVAISIWPDYRDPDALSVFRTVILYNFAISLVLSAPVAMIATRFLADRMYDGDESQISGTIVLSTLGAMASQIPVPLALYFLIANVTPAFALLACANYFAVAGLWIAVVFLSTLKNYSAVIFAFVAGLGLSAAGAVALAPWGAPGLMAGFTAGLTLTLFLLLGRATGEFPKALVWPSGFVRAFRTFPPLAGTAIAYNAAIWIDKWIFWVSPSYSQPIAGLPTFPAYDGAMFYAHLTLAPGLAVFFALVETGFYLRYRRFYWFVQHHGTLAEIEKAHAELVTDAKRGARTLLALHAAIALAALLMAPGIADALALMPGQIGIFRFAVLGTAAHGFFLYAIVLLGYFDLRKRVLMLSLLFLVLNTVFTIASQYLGFAFFGAGYFLAALVSATAAVYTAQYELKRLRYLTFVANNPSTGRSL